MGGVVSAGEDNDNLVENLVEANYIRTPTLIDIFRAVDRAHYYLKDQRNSAYHDIAWKSNHLHLSAPCIYSEVMERLDLGPGMSFLNLGSGTGYLSTMAGLILGPYGVNHGVEIHADVVDYAHERLKEYIVKAPTFDRFEFCHPQFAVGNCLRLPPGTPGYDRVYCGAACPPEFAGYLMNLLKIGGKLVLPLEDKLQIKTRTGEQEWDSESTMAVSFAHLILPSSSDEEQTPTPLPERTVLSLQNLCRFCIRRAIRNKYEVAMPPKTRRKKRKRHRSTGIDEHLVSRRREMCRRIRRINTLVENGSARRRRMNTLGDSDHGDSSSESIDSSEDERESGDEDMGTGEQKEQTDIVDDVIDEDDGSSPQNELADDTSDITLDDNGKKENGEPGNGLPEPSGSKNGNKGKDSSTSGPSKRSRRRYNFRFFRSRQSDQAHQHGGETSTASDRTDTDGSGTSTQARCRREGGGDTTEYEERQLIRPIRRSHLAYSLLRGLRHCVAEKQAAIKPGEKSSDKEGSDSVCSEFDSEKAMSEESENESKEIFEPLSETPFTISIRKLPLPPRLKSFLLYHRQ